MTLIYLLYLSLKNHHHRQPTSLLLYTKSQTSKYPVSPSHLLLHMCYDFSFLLSHRSSDASLLFWTNFFPSFVDALRLNPASITSRRAWLTSPFSRTSFTSCATCCTAYILLSHGPLTLYIRLSFSALDTAWSVRRVSTYIRRLLLYLYL